jgi:hypothetical protein
MKRWQNLIASCLLLFAIAGSEASVFAKNMQEGKKGKDKPPKVIIREPKRPEQNPDRNPPPPPKEERPPKEKRKP